jgi:2-desacetyl-2-hydroxyethyl bacteriochlorophyllide A dehydrogenase
VNYLKAAVFLGPKRVKVTDVETPKISSNEVLIKTKSVGVCGTDLHFYLGAHGKFQNLLERIKKLIFPTETIIGHEFSGFVADKGKNIDDFQLKDKVTALPIISCHRCKYCKTGFTHLCENINPWPGAFAEYIKVPSKNIVRVPKEISYEEAAILEPLACTLHAIKMAKIEKGDSVAILGAGTIGLLLLQIFKSLNVKEIVVTDILDFKLEMAKKLGADITVKASEINYYKNKGLINDVNLVFECVGSPAPTLHQAIDLIDKRGRIVVLGSFFFPQKIDMLKFRQKELTMLGSEPANKEDFIDGIKLLNDNKVRLKPLITHTFPLRNISEAFETALKSKQTKSIKVEIILSGDSKEF